MEAVVHLDRSVTMPSQSQMAYSRPTSIHGRQNQPPAELCYKPNSASSNNPGGPNNSGPGIIASSSGSNQRHSPATFSSGSAGYGPMRYLHGAYPPNTGVTPVSYRDNPYASRSSELHSVFKVFFQKVEQVKADNVVGERGQPMVEYALRGENMPSQSKPRISLLTSPEYINSLSSRRHHPEDSYRGLSVPANVQPIDVNTSSKKIRLGDAKSDLQRTLRIDTRGHSKQDEGQQVTAYTPQVEAISPTLPTEVLQDETFRSTKDELLHGISKVDREITKTELQISTLKRKQQELEEAAKKPEGETEEEEVPQPKHHSPAQKIYADNRRKAQEAHALLKHMGPTVQLPLYNQPSDTAVYHENKRRHQLFKDRLMLHLRKKHAERESREKRLTTTYSVLVQGWLRKVEKVENSQKRKAREAKNREFFEKVFPRLRKMREDRERFNRVGARVKSEADLEEIMDGLQEQEMEDKKMRSYAVVPPLLLDAKQRSVFYVNNNGRINDFPNEYKERHLLNVWTQAEKDIFKEKFLQHPKNFGVIASYLEKKSVSDCVQYYYLSKKTENYKRLLRKSRVRSRSGRNPQAKVNTGAAPTSSSDLLSTATGVTTRFQREQLQKQEPIPSTSSAENRPPPLISEGGSEEPAQPNFLPESPPLPPPPLLLQHSEKPEEKSDVESKDTTKLKKADPETSDDDQYERPCDGDGDHQTTHLVECIVCKTNTTTSRALAKSQASQYGLKEDEVPLDARVCNLCRCKAVRSRFMHCPVSSCPNAKMQRVKRLRSLPIKWVDIIPVVREQLQIEFGMDESLTKCCSLCYNRIVRKISASMDVSSFMSHKGKMSQARCSILNWTDEEIQKLKDGLKVHGVNWAQVAEVVGSGKTPQQCMAFFYKYMKKLNLEHHLPPDVKDVVLAERKPVLTDEEESGSSTSSCDEMEGSRVDGGADSDTASAPSPVQNTVLEEDCKETSTTPPPHLIEEGRISITNPSTPERTGSNSSPQSKGGSNSSLLPPVLLPNKEDYDSSATETADEGQGGGETELGPNQAPVPKRDEEPNSPLTVKDLMLNVIEMQLMKNQTQGSNSTNQGCPPTISSILKSDSSITYTQRERNTSRVNTDNNSLATVSVVGSQHSHQTPVQDLRKEGLVVVQVPQNVRESREPEGVTLDLSIKKPRDSQPQQSKPVPRHSSPQPSHSVYRIPQQNPPQSMAQLQQVQQQSMQQSHSQQQSHQPQQSGGDSSGFFHQQILPPPLAPKLSPGVITGTPQNKPQCGSIIHGTPVSSPSIYNQARYEQQAATPIILHTSPHKEPGSITQGTPVHQRTSIFPSNSEALFSKRMVSQGFYPSRPTPFNVEQRQIIMNDFITSQQMPSSSGSRNGREKIYYQPTSARQGVIQRHNTKPPSPGVSHHPPGYEAFSSLVDVASRQPSLPVPSPMQMPMAELKPMAEEKRHLHGEGLGERFNRDSPHDRFQSRESDLRYVKESSKVHPQPPDRREHQQQSSSTLLQLREQISHGRDNYSSHHMEREMSSHQMNIRESERMQREQRERDHHNHQTQKIREHQMHVQQQRDLEMRGVQRAMQNYPQRIIHDPHINMDQRLIQVQIYREQPSSSQPSAPSSSSHAPPPRAPKQEQSSESLAVRNRPNESSTLTAASLIDAIITHQINQSSDGQSSVPSGSGGGQQSQHTRPGDRLFQSFHRECSESNGKVSPMKANLSNESKGQHSSSQPQLHVSEHHEVYGSQPQGMRGEMRSSMYQSYDQTWKLRRALQQKDAEQERREHEKSEQEHVGRGYYSDPPVPLSPLDYVKNRIAEVMRTSEEDGTTTKGGESPISPDGPEEIESTPVVPSTPYISQNPHAYTYPYSALSLTAGSSANVSMTPQSVNKQGNESIPEPAPLLQAQYEPLSDED